ncbi:M42 family metallopeptidase [Candidatus Acetothermia bacterium]|nr:M42 family metallopeptidase [Candidatus Acetothermia bacterium]MBI3643304.1 M42 family metallopeptidase [Candidatus Acetothermia bacterium]
MKKNSLAFLKRLMETISPSGFEQEAAKVWMAEAKTFADKVWSDQHGNCYALINGGGGPRVMLAGHIDEIGLMITHIDEKGFLYFTNIGGWDAQVLVGQRVWVNAKRGRVLGVIGKKPIHLMQAKERENAVKIDDLWIDIGSKDKKDAEKRVGVGDPTVLAYGMEELPNDLLVSRGFDDKAGAFVVLEAARLLSQMNPKAEVYAVATVQEEIGLRGATTSSFHIDPQVGIAVDVEFATDFPSMDSEKKKLGEILIGKGPGVMRGANINHVLFDLMVEAGDKEKIPYQVTGYPGGTGTDANAMQLARAGVATGLIGVPNRYMHSPCEIVHMDDLENSAKIIAHAVRRIDKKSDFTWAK